MGRYTTYFAIGAALIMGIVVVGGCLPTSDYVSSDASDRVIFVTSDGTGLNDEVYLRVDMSTFVNPGDIESRDILKDAAAAAIYGAEAGNGVILITSNLPGVITMSASSMSALKASACSLVGNSGPMYIVDVADAADLLAAQERINGRAVVETEQLLASGLRNDGRIWVPKGMPIGASIAGISAPAIVGEMAWAPVMFASANVPGSLVYTNLCPFYVELTWAL